MTTVRTYLEASPELGEIRICTYGVNGGELKQVAIKSAQRLQLIEQRRENRREAGRKIDPASAFVTVAHRDLLDPYDDGDFIPPEVRCLGAVEFARAPDSTSGSTSPICPRQLLMHCASNRIGNRRGKTTTFRSDRRRDGLGKAPSRPWRRSCWQHAARLWSRAPAA